MAYGKRTLQILGCISLILLATSVSQASSIIAVTTPFTGTDSINWGSVGDQGASVPNSTLPGGSFTTGGGNAIAIDFSANIDGLIVSAGGTGQDTWQGGYNPSGTLLLSTNVDVQDYPSPVIPDTLTLTFTNPISEIGVYLQVDDYTDAFTGTISTTSDGGGSSSVLSSGGTGTQVFLGLQDTNGSFITSVTFSATQSIPGGTPDWFVLGPAQLESSNGTITGQVPEPGSILLMAGGIAVLAWKARKRARA